MIILMMIIICIVVCSIPSPTGYGTLEGEVINKKHEAATTMVQMIHAGKVMVPNTIHVPEKWKIEIEKDVNRRNKNNMGYVN